MPIFQNGKAPVAMRYIDPAGVEHHVVAAYLGDRLVWDGTVPASVTAPRMHGGGGVPLPAVCAAAALDAPILSGTGEMLVPLPGGGGGVSVPLFAGDADVLEPLIGGSATVAPEAMEGHGELHEPGIGTEVPGVAIVPTATGAGSISTPTVRVPATIEAPVAEGSGIVSEAQVTAGAALAVPSGSGAGEVLTPTVTAAALVDLPLMAGSGAMPIPTHAAGHSVEVPAMEGSGEMLVPSVEAANLVPAGIVKSGTQSLPSSNTWHQVTGWVVDSAYPDTTLSSNAIVVDGSGSAVLSAAVAWSTANGNRQCRIKVNGTVVATSAVTTGTPTISDFETELEPGDLVTLEAHTTTVFSAYRTIAVSGTFLRLAAVVPMYLRAQDTFDGDGPLSSNWITTGGGVLERVNGRLDGTNTPSVPLSYAWWHEPMPSDTQQVECVVRWDGRNPEHSACGLVVRADPFQDPVNNPGAQFGVQFSWTRGIMALYYEDYDAPNGFVPVTGVPQYVTTSKFPEGAVVTLRAEGNLYTARVNGVIMLQGTVASSVIPFSRRWVGATIQNDELVSGGGGPPGRIDDFRALTP